MNVGTVGRQQEESTAERNGAHATAKHECTNRIEWWSNSHPEWPHAIVSHNLESRNVRCDAISHSMRNSHAAMGNREREMSLKQKHTTAYKTRPTLFVTPPSSAIEKKTPSIIDVSTLPATYNGRIVSSSHLSYRAASKPSNTTFCPKQRSKRQLTSPIRQHHSNESSHSPGLQRDWLLYRPDVPPSRAGIMTSQLLFFSTHGQ